MQHIPAGCEGEIDVSNQSCTVNEVNEFSAERNEDDGAEEASCRQAKVTENVENSFVSTTGSLTFDTAEDVYKKKLIFKFSPILAYLIMLFPLILMLI